MWRFHKSLIKKWLCLKDIIHFLMSGNSLKESIRLEGLILRR